MESPGYDRSLCGYGGGVLCQRKLFSEWISRGIGTEADEGVLYGSVLAEVYELESKVAQYPRIVVADSVLEIIEEAYGESTFRRWLWRKDVKDYLIKDTDGKFIVHMFRKEIFELLSKT